MIGHKKKRIFLKKDNYGYLFIAPFFITLFLFSVVPILSSFVISFTKWNNYSNMTFIGFDNYKRIFDHGLIFKAIFNTLRIMALSLPLGISLSLFLAFILHRKIFKAHNALRTIYFLPYITTPVAVGFLFSLLFNYRIGLVNTVLLRIGLIEEHIYWMSKPIYVVLIVSFLVLWKTFGYNTVLFYAGLQSIPEEIYEASRVDGASLTQQFFRITLPLLKPITYFVIVTSIIWGFQIFDEPAMLFIGADSSASIANTLGGPDKSVYTLVSYIYEEGFALFRPGMASAVAFIMAFIIIVFSAFTTNIIKIGRNDE